MAVCRAWTTTRSAPRPPGGSNEYGAPHEYRYAGNAAGNVDAAELAKFGALAHRWWDTESEMFGPLHRLNPLRLAHIDRLVGGLVGKRVVDVGCGGGILAESMAAAGARVTGIDLGEKALKVAMLHRLESGVELDYRLVSAEDAALAEAGSYDVVTCMEMLEHVPDPASTVRACATLAKPGGWVVFSTINRNAKSFLFAIVGAEYVLRLLPRGTHEYAKFITPSELAAHCRAAALEMADITGMTYNPLAKVFALGTDARVNYFLAARRSGVTPERAGP
ncbi:MAG: bifunctional 2-polyprenyl-6-hydroxyphenol methylase/3-demethylubiquinol 3-O-methyltransferase UbiG [Betaproteobacteria bacterium]|nr:bifunctional 2-polyprenyl-6-hydroxyphenol methylase/3-demethylubiquinol 3-O-methyltransferase UbiG [Betaproteobacteria bacterium]